MPSFADTIDIGRHVADKTVGVAADVCLADVVAENDENVGFFGLCFSLYAEDGG
jgi:hypothetical protein